MEGWKRRNKARKDKTEGKKEGRRKWPLHVASSPLQKKIFTLEKWRKKYDKERPKTMSGCGNLEELSRDNGGRREDVTEMLSKRENKTENGRRQEER